jgi:O-antigen ligase
LFLIAVLVAPQWGRTTLLCFTGGLIAISIVAVPFADAIWQQDPNTGIRLFFWRDAISRIVQSYGIGQGFGTETIRPIYELSSGDVTIAGLDQEDFIMVGSHNAFIDAGYRMGLIGMTILVAYIVSLFRTMITVADDNRSFDYFACALLFVILMVNVGLTSINFLFGASFVLGWLAFRTTLRPLDVRREMGVARL